MNGPRFCLITTLEPGGTRRATAARCAVDQGRLLLRAPATSDLPARVWRSSKVTIAPCTQSGRSLGPPADVAARVMAAPEEPAAEAALAAGDGPAERVGLWIQRLRGVEMLYLEARVAKEEPAAGDAGPATGSPSIGGPSRRHLGCASRRVA